MHDDGFASFTYAHMALREIKVRSGEVPPINGMEDRWKLEGPVPNDKLESLSLPVPGERTPPAETLNDQKGSG